MNAEIYTPEPKPASPTAIPNDAQLARLKNDSLKTLGLIKQVHEVLGAQGAELRNQHAQLDRLTADGTFSNYYFHCPMDYERETYPPDLGTPRYVAGEELPLPPPDYRPGYAPDDDALYLRWGKSDHQQVCDMVKKHHQGYDNLTILDFGCSSGRVLRHFLAEHRAHGWKPIGIDIQAKLIEWTRRYFPKELTVLSGSAFPHLPFADNSIDVIFGISVFTHTKYLWDTWLMEFKRVLKPGGLVMQSVQCEAAWEFYHKNRHEKWVADGHPASMLREPHMTHDYLLYGDPSVSQTFYRKDVIIDFWGRYMEVVDFLPPPQFSYQNWIVLRKEG